MNFKKAEKLSNKNSNQTKNEPTLVEQSTVKEPSENHDDQSFVNQNQKPLNPNEHLRRNSFNKNRKKSHSNKKTKSQPNNLTSPSSSKNETTFARNFLGSENFVETSRIPKMKLSGLEHLENDHKRKARFQKNRSKPCSIPTKIYVLGGIEEIGKNMYCIEHHDEIIIIDCGIKFANKRDLPGISGIIPSFAYLKENEKKIKALIVTHGHEDHIGGVPYLLKQINVPVVYAPVIASELILRKVNEHKNAILHKMEVYTDESVFQTKYLTIDFYRVNHSIPDSFGVAVRTPNGNIASSGDFRFDFSSDADKTDIIKISAIAHRKIDVLLCESTNAENEGFNESENHVLKEINNLISSCHGKILITSFASNLGRIEEIIRIGIKRNRKIIVVGRSMVNNIAVSRKVGYLKLDDSLMIQARDINKYPDNEIMIICTGSQGEETAALNTIAKGRHAWIKLKPTDTVILSSNAIPGNFVSVDELINTISKSGCKVYYNSANLKIHSSGHGAKMEQQLLISLINPKYLVPIHGEYKMLRKLQQSANELGIAKENVFIISNGQVLDLFNHVLTHSTANPVDASEVYIDAHHATLEGSKIINDRLRMSENGVIFSQIYLDLKQKLIVYVAPVAAAGSFYSYDSLALFKKIMYQIHSELNKILAEPKVLSIDKMEKFIAAKLSSLIWHEKNKRPVIVVKIKNINKAKFWDHAIKLVPKKNKKLDQEDKQTTDLNRDLVQE
ncbi:Ribonuclease J [[Mycoplasma] cavipharyngis]|uniref:ribonuclease J n=1 Tax=[Mycoplasma] cavipharyngis TaxID=92757 RepID=UPI0037044E80